MEVAIAVTLDAAIRTSSAESIPSVPIFRWPSRTAGFAQQHDGSEHRRGVSIEQFLTILITCHVNE